MRKLPKSVTVLAPGIASVSIGASSSLAIPITYTEEATASGSLDGIAFTNANVVLSMNNDTTNVTTIPAFPSQFFNIGTTTVSVAGVGTDTFTGTIAANVGPTALSGGAGFYDLSLFRDMLYTINAAFATYALTTCNRTDYG